MPLMELIERRRAYRSLEPVEVDEGMIEDLASHARLSASCFNNQPWRYIFVHGPAALDRTKEALAKGNEWARKASMIIAVFSRPDYDCRIREREYYLFDTGMATAHLILRATELGLVAHPIAGFSPKRVKEALNIPEEMMHLTLIIVGRWAGEAHPDLSDTQRRDELRRPERMDIREFAFIDRYPGEGGPEDGG